MLPYLRLTHEAGQGHGGWHSSKRLHGQAGDHSRHQSGSEQLLLLLLLLMLQHLQL